MLNFLGSLYRNPALILLSRITVKKGINMTFLHPASLCD